jgi:hypothetical protein
MRISVIEYTAFQNVCAEMSGASGPAHVFYAANGGNVSQALAICTGGFYVQFDGTPVSTATFTGDFPAAIAAGTSVQSAY